MPVYEYECQTCGKNLEVLQTMSQVFSSCSEIDPNCDKNGVLKKKLSTFAFTGSQESPNVCDPSSCGMSDSDRSPHNGCMCC